MASHATATKAHPLLEVRDREAENQSPEHTVGEHRPVGGGDEALEYQEHLVRS
jgi:hypothetical protein